MRRSCRTIGFYERLTFGCQPATDSSTPDSGTPPTGGSGGTGGATDAAPPGTDGLGCPTACPPGARQCGADGRLQLCADYDADGCPEWGGDLECPAGSRCDAGECAATCPEPCTVGELICTAEGRRECRAAAADGCAAFEPAPPCAADERCDGGACVPVGSPCSDACPTDGERLCEGNGYRACGQHDEDACLDLSMTVPCPAGTVCVNAGECVPDCSDECEPGSTVCQGAGVAVCGNFDHDTCLELGPATACREDECCDGGACVPADQPCEPECLHADERVCADGGSFRQCGQYNVDECLELSPPVSCAATEACADGRCARVCDDECVDRGRQCGEGGLQTCGNFDADACLEWSAPAPCEGGTQCDDGECVAIIGPCEDACVPGVSRCGVAGPQACADFDDDACVEWGPEVPCCAGQRCEGDQCVDACVDECTADTTDCLGDALVRCGELDGDACLELGPPEACPQSQSCSGGACRDVCVED